MSQDNEIKQACQEECVIQDGVSCPKKSPFPARVAMITGIPILLIMAMAVVVLAATDVWRLVIWLAVALAFLIPLRALICARCPYYGQTCSTGFGKLVPLMFKKQEGKSMVLGLWLDVVAMTFLFIYPLSDMWAYSGWTALGLWCLLYLGMVLALTKIACSLCPFTFCPIGKMGRAIWGFLEPKGNRD